MSELDKNENFSIINLSSEADWDICKNTLLFSISEVDFKKIREYLKPVAKSVIIEFNYECKDYKNSYHNFYSKKFTEYKRKCSRLHFFDVDLDIDKIWALDDNYAANYIGYIVLRPLDRFSIGRTMLNPSLVGVKDATLFTCDNEVNLLGSKFKIEAFPFMGQDTDVTVCAHASIWMILRYFSQRYNYYPEIRPFEIACLTKDVSLGRLLPSKGLTMSQISEIISNYGMHPDLCIRNYSKNFDKILYYYIESGIPIIASVANKHALAIFGHCTNLNFEALIEYDYKGFKYFNSADLINGFVVNDDNYLPYRYLLKKKTAGDKVSEYHYSEIDSFIAPLNEKIYLSAEEMETLALSIISHPTLGFKQHTKRFKDDKLILRMFLTSSRRYKHFRRRNPVYAGIEKFYIELPMPRFIWVVEISTVGKYREGKVVGEIIFDSTANKYDMFSFMYIHYPGFFLINDRNKIGDDPDRFKVSEIELENVSDYSIFISNLRRA